MKIAVLGTGCPKCKKLYENTLKALELSGKEAEIVKVEDIKEIQSYNVFMTPALVIDDKVRSSGKLLKPDVIRKIIEEN